MDSPALVSPQSKMPNKAKSGAKTGQQRRPKDGRAPPSDLGSREPLKSGLSGKKGAPDSDLGASKTSKRDKPRTFRELLAESQGPVQELEKEREARTNRDELEKLMRGGHQLQKFNDKNC